MSFENRLLPARPTGESVSASVSQKGPTLRLMLRFTTRLSLHVAHDRCDVVEGSDADEGRLALIFGDAGAFGVYRKQPGRGLPSVHLFLPVPACVPQPYILSAVVASHRWDTPRVRVVVTLPLAAWRESVAAYPSEGD